MFPGGSLDQLPSYKKNAQPCGLVGGCETSYCKDRDKLISCQLFLAKDQEIPKKDSFINLHCDFLQYI